MKQNHKLLPSFTINCFSVVNSRKSVTRPLGTFSLSPDYSSAGCLRRERGKEREERERERWSVRVMIIPLSP